MRRLSPGVKRVFVSFYFYCLVITFCGKCYKFCWPAGLYWANCAPCLRFFVGYDNRLLVVVSALLGSTFTLLCDILARTLFAPYEIPVGIIMSFLGGPFFIYLLLKQRRRVIND